MTSFLQWRQLNEQVSADQLQRIERYVDSLFQQYRVNVVFSPHFLERVNDSRNKPAITVAELLALFNKEFKMHGKAIATMRVGDEGLMRDLSNDLNVPIVIKWNSTKKQLQMMNKTIMRKKAFGNDNFNDKLLTVR